MTTPDILKCVKIYHDTRYFEVKILTKDMKMEITQAENFLFLNKEKLFIKCQEVDFSNNSIFSRRNIKDIFPQEILLVRELEYFVNYICQKFCYWN